MFDTSIVRAQAATAPRRLTLLTASLAIHSAAIIAAITLSLASTSLPTDAPRQVEIFRTAEVPPGPPPPLGPAVRPKQPAATTPVKPHVPEEVTAPREIPVDTPQLETPQVAGSGEPGTGDQPVGDPNGVPGGVGEPGGGGGTGTQVPDAVYQPVGEVTSARVLTRVQPQFPQSMIRAIRSATVVVFCVIDKQGRIRDPKIVMSSYPPFNQAVLDALHQWTFAAGSYRGHAVDTYFELRVKFEVR